MNRFEKNQHCHQKRANNRARNRAAVIAVVAVNQPRRHHKRRTDNEVRELTHTAGDGLRKQHKVFHKAKTATPLTGPSVNAAIVPAARKSRAK